MSQQTASAGSLALPPSAPAPARAVFSLLRRVEHGTLDVQLPDGTVLRFGGDSEPRAAIRLANWNVCSAALRSGDIGFAESFFAGDWTTPDLPALLRFFLRNRNQVETVIFGSWWGSLLYRLKHLLNRNTRRGSAKNISAHYDLGNDFYRLWLDPTMTYSSAWFEGDRQRPLDEAQRTKVRRVLRECGAAPGRRILEIGCGWGGLAELAAREYGAHTTGITLSREQLDYARHRAEGAGVDALTELRFQDYRDLARSGETFDGVASIEMFEAVGREYWPGYFATVAAVLKPGGRACVQTITIRDDLFDRYVRSTDFIQQYIFPGGLLPSASEFRRHAAQAGLEVVNELAFGLDYAETLRRWRHTFLHEEAAVRQLGFDARFMRIWEFYLAYCEAAFATGSTDVVQFTLRRAGAAGSAS